VCAAAVAAGLLLQLSKLHCSALIKINTDTVCMYTRPGSSQIYFRNIIWGATPEQEVYFLRWFIPRAKFLHGAGGLAILLLFFTCNYARGKYFLNAHSLICYWLPSVARAIEHSAGSGEKASEKQALDADDNLNLACQKRMRQFVALGKETHAPGRGHFSQHFLFCSWTCQSRFSAFTKICKMITFKKF
jgi:hypothetical protein